MTTAVIIATYNRRDLLAGCLARLAEHLKGSLVISIAQDGEPRLGAWARMAEAARCVERGARELLFMHDDVLIHADPRPALRACAEALGAAIVGGMVQRAGGIADLWVELGADSVPRTIEDPGSLLGYEARLVSAANFACALVSAAVWRELNGFDPAFTHHFAEVDMCLRARERGYKAAACPLPLATHLRSSSGWGPIEEDQARFVARWRPDGSRRSKSRE